MYVHIIKILLVDFLLSLRGIRKQIHFQLRIFEYIFFCDEPRAQTTHLQTTTNLL